MRFIKKGVRGYMTDEMKTNIALIVGVCLFIILFIFVFIRGFVKSAQFIKAAKENGCTTMGKAVMAEDSDGNGTGQYRDSIVTYAYEVGCEKYTRNITFRKHGRQADYPSELTVYYDMHNPSKSMTDFDVQFSYRHQFRLCVAVFIPIFATALFYGLISFVCNIYEFFVLSEQFSNYL